MAPGYGAAVRPKRADLLLAAADRRSRSLALPTISQVSPLRRSPMVTVLVNEVGVPAKPRFTGWCPDKEQFKAPATSLSPSASLNWNEEVTVLELPLPP